VDDEIVKVRDLQEATSVMVAHQIRDAFTADDLLAPATRGLLRRLVEIDMETNPGGVMMRPPVERYLREHGHTLPSVRALPEARRRLVLAAAARFAAREMTKSVTTVRPAFPDESSGGCTTMEARC